MAKKASRGRPKTGLAKKQHPIRFDAVEHAEYLALAEKSRRSFGDWVRVTLRKAVDAGVAEGQQ